MAKGNNGSKRQSKGEDKYFEQQIAHISLSNWRGLLDFPCRQRSRYSNTYSSFVKLSAPAINGEFACDYSILRHFKMLLRKACVLLDTDFSLNLLIFSPHNFLAREE